MAKIDKLLKLITKRNLAEDLPEERQTEIARDIISGYKVDDKTRQDWLSVNREAMRIIKHCEEDGGGKVDLFEGQCKIIFPLLAPAIIQLASRLSSHTVRNGRTVECTVLGKDQQIPDPGELEQIKQYVNSPEYQQQAAQAMQQGQQPPPPPQPKMMWAKQDKSKRVSGFMNYKLLVQSKTWRTEDIKLDGIVSGWGTGFKYVTYDFVTKDVKSYLLDPENVIINHNISCLEEAPRVTIKHYLTKNQVVEQIRSGYFLDLDLELLVPYSASENGVRNDGDDEQPVYEFLCQHTNIDLDDDGYAEPYKCYVHTGKEMLFSIVPAFEEKDIEVVVEEGSDHYGMVQTIKRRLDIVDRHCIHSPDGKYYSLGLNYLLLHNNKAITSILRQLIDAGILKNASAVSGFVTKAFKTREREISFTLGKFEVLDCDSAINPQEQIIKMPMEEPSQVLLALLQLLIDTGKNSGFISDILTGDVEMQNVPATTTLAMTEQATRAFKPIISNKIISEQTEFQMMFHLYSKHLDKEQYAKFQGEVIAVTKDDFNEDITDVVPVADPTMASEATQFAKCRALIDGMQVFGGVTNPQEAALRYWSGMQFENPDKLVQQQQQGPDPKVLEIQLKTKIADQEFELEKLRASFEATKVENDTKRVQLEETELRTKINEIGAKVAKMEADAKHDIKMANIQDKNADTQAKAMETAARAAKVNTSDDK